MTAAGAAAMQGQRRCRAIVPPAPVAKGAVDDSPLPRYARAFPGIDR